MGRRLGNYQVRGLIGCGAMGAVYLAQDAVLERPVALKVLLGSLARSPEQVRRFQREARAAAPLSHPNIVRIYEAGVREGIPFMAMEFVDGESFDRFLLRSGTLPWRRALEIAEQMARALACAHENGVVHRDVKPSNMLIDAKGRMRLTDFGIARMRDHSTGLTEHDLFLGTPEFMSPEQCEGRKDIGPATDLFSLGVTVYRMISGRMPFAGFNTAALIASITHEIPPRLNRISADVPDDVARLVAHLLEKDPASRPESAEQVADTIAQLLENDGGSSAMSAALDAFIRDQAEPREMEFWTPTPGATKATKSKRTTFRQNRRRRLYAPISVGARVVAALCITVAALGAVYWYSSGSPEVVSAAPKLDKVVFQPREPGVYSVPLPSDAWVVKELAWTPRTPKLLLALGGRSGSFAQGSNGLLALSPDTGDLTILASPSNPWRTTRSLEVPQPVLSSSLADGNEGSILRSAPLGTDGAVALLLQDSGYARPSSEVLASLRGDEWGNRPKDPYAPYQPGSAILTPDGKALVLALNDAAPGKFNLYRQSLDGAKPGTRTALLDEPLELQPDSLAVAPGNLDVYFIARSANGGTLYRVSMNAGHRLELVARGDFHAPLVILPGEKHLVAAVAGSDSSQLYRVSLDGNGEMVPFGVGEISHSPVIDDSGTLLISENKADVATLSVLDPMSPGVRGQLLHLQGVRLHSAVANAHGAWGAAAVEHPTHTELIVLDLKAMRSSGALNGQRVASL